MQLKCDSVKLWPLSTYVTVINSAHRVVSVKGEFFEKILQGDKFADMEGPTDLSRKIIFEIYYLVSNEGLEVFVVEIN